MFAMKVCQCCSFPVSGRHTATYSKRPGYASAARSQCQAATRPPTPRGRGMPALLVPSVRPPHGHLLQEAGVCQRCSFPVSGRHTATYSKRPGYASAARSQCQAATRPPTPRGRGMPALLVPSVRPPHGHLLQEAGVCQRCSFPVSGRHTATYSKRPGYASAARSQCQAATRPPTPRGRGMPALLVPSVRPPHGHLLQEAGVCQRCSFPVSGRHTATYSKRPGYASAARSQCQAATRPPTPRGRGMPALLVPSVRPPHGHLLQEAVVCQRCSFPVSGRHTATYSKRPGYASAARSQCQAATRPPTPRGRGMPALIVPSVRPPHGHLLQEAGVCQRCSFPVSGRHTATYSKRPGYASAARSQCQAATRPPTPRGRGMPALLVPSVRPPHGHLLQRPGYASAARSQCQAATRPPTPRGRGMPAQLVPSVRPPHGHLLQEARVCQRCSFPVSGRHTATYSKRPGYASAARSQCQAATRPPTPRGRGMPALLVPSVRPPHGHLLQEAVVCQRCSFPVSGRHTATYSKRPGYASAARSVRPPHGHLLQEAGVCQRCSFPVSGRHTATYSKRPWYASAARSQCQAATRPPTPRGRGMPALLVPSVRPPHGHLLQEAVVCQRCSFPVSGRHTATYSKRPGYASAARSQCQAATRPPTPRGRGMPALLVPSVRPPHGHLLQEAVVCQRCSFPVSGRHTATYSKRPGYASAARSQCQAATRPPTPRGRGMPALLVPSVRPPHGHLLQEAVVCQRCSFPVSGRHTATYSKRPWYASAARSQCQAATRQPTPRGRGMPALLVPSVRPPHGHLLQEAGVCQRCSFPVSGRHTATYSKRPWYASAARSQCQAATRPPTPRGRGMPALLVPSVRPPHGHLLQEAGVCQRCSFPVSGRHTATYSKRPWYASAARSQCQAATRPPTPRGRGMPALLVPSVRPPHGHLLQEAGVCQRCSFPVSGRHTATYSKRPWYASAARSQCQATTRPPTPRGRGMPALLVPSVRPPHGHLLQEAGVCQRCSFPVSGRHTATYSKRPGYASAARSQCQAATRPPTPRGRGMPALLVPSVRPPHGHLLQEAGVCQRCSFPVSGRHTATYSKRPWYASAARSQCQAATRPPTPIGRGMPALLVPSVRPPHGHLLQEAGVCQRCSFPVSGRHTATYSKRPWYASAARSQCQAATRPPTPRGRGMPALLVPSVRPPHGHLLQEAVVCQRCSFPVSGRHTATYSKRPWYASAARSQCQAATRPPTPRGRGMPALLVPSVRPPHGHLLQEAVVCQRCSFPVSGRHTATYSKRPWYASAARSQCQAATWPPTPRGRGMPALLVPSVRPPHGHLLQEAVVCQRCSFPVSGRHTATYSKRPWYASAARSQCQATTRPPTPRGRGMPAQLVPSVRPPHGYLLQEAVVCQRSSFPVSGRHTATYSKRPWYASAARSQCQAATRPPTPRGRGMPAQLVPSVRPPHGHLLQEAVVCQRSSFPVSGRHTATYSKRPWYASAARSQCQAATRPPTPRGRGMPAQLVPSVRPPHGHLLQEAVVCQRCSFPVSGRHTATYSKRPWYASAARSQCQAATRPPTPRGRGMPAQLVPSVRPPHGHLLQEAVVCQRSSFPVSDRHTATYSKRPWYASAARSQCQAATRPPTPRGRGMPAQLVPSVRPPHGHLLQEAVVCQHCSFPVSGRHTATYSKRPWYASAAGSKCQAATRPPTPRGRGMPALLVPSVRPPHGHLLQEAVVCQRCSFPVSGRHTATYSKRPWYASAARSQCQAATRPPTPRGRGMPALLVPSVRPPHGHLLQEAGVCQRCSFPVSGRHTATYSKRPWYASAARSQCQAATRPPTPRGRGMPALLVPSVRPPHGHLLQEAVVCQRSSFPVSGRHTATYSKRPWYASTARSQCQAATRPPTPRGRGMPALLVPSVRPPHGHLLQEAVVCQRCSFPVSGRHTATYSKRPWYASAARSQCQAATRPPTPRGRGMPAQLVPSVRPPHGHLLQEAVVCQHCSFPVSGRHTATYSKRPWYASAARSKCQAATRPPTPRGRGMPALLVPSVRPPHGHLLQEAVVCQRCSFPVSGRHTATYSKRPWYASAARSQCQAATRPLTPRGRGMPALLVSSVRPPHGHLLQEAVVCQRCSFPVSGRHTATYSKRPWYASAARSQCQAATRPPTPRGRGMPALLVPSVRPPHGHLLQEAVVCQRCSFPVSGRHTATYSKRPGYASAARSQCQAATRPPTPRGRGMPAQLVPSVRPPHGHLLQEAGEKIPPGENPPRR
ncbi:hypothetical protein ACOMHN_008731 [Nucella lapillus]